MLLTIEQLITKTTSNVNKMPAADALVLLKQINGILIDVREPAEFNQFSIEGAINIPRGLLEMQVLQKFPDANTPIFIHCAAGVRACLSAAQLNTLGYETVIAITCKPIVIAEQNALLN